MKPILDIIIILLFDSSHHNFMLNSCTESYTSGIMLITLNYWSRLSLLPKEDIVNLHIKDKMPAPNLFYYSEVLLYIVKTLNNGHVGSRTPVHCKDAVFSWRLTS